MKRTKPDDPIGFNAPKYQPPTYQGVAVSLLAATLVAILVVILLAARHPSSGCIALLKGVC